MWQFTIKYQAQMQNSCYRTSVGSAHNVHMVIENQQEHANGVYLNLHIYTQHVKPRATPYLFRWITKRRPSPTPTSKITAIDRLYYLYLRFSLLKIETISLESVNQSVHILATSAWMAFFEVSILGELLDFPEDLQRKMVESPLLWWADL